MTIQVANLIAPKNIQIEKRPVPDLSENEALVEVSAAGVCGTDLSLYSGNYTVPLPLVLGHEWEGRVQAVHSDQDQNLVGKRVVCDINNSCISYRRKDLCAACQKGIPTHCLCRTVTGIISYDGAFATHIVVPVENLEPLPEDFPVNQGILIEPLAAALRIFEVFEWNKGDKILVMGCGRLGLLIAIVAKNLGFDVIATARSKGKIKLAESFGIDCISVNENNEKLKSIIDQKTNGLGMDVVVDVTGNVSSFNDAFEYVRPRGVIALKNTPGAGDPKIPMTQTVVDEIQISSSRCGNFKTAIEFFSTSKLDLKNIITNKFKLTEIESAFKTANTEPGKAMIKVK